MVLGIGEDKLERAFDRPADDFATCICASAHGVLGFFIHVFHVPKVF